MQMNRQVHGGRREVVHCLSFSQIGAFQSLIISENLFHHLLQPFAVSELSISVTYGDGEVRDLHYYRDGLKTMKTDWEICMY